MVVDICTSISRHGPGTFYVEAILTMVESADDVLRRTKPETPSRSAKVGPPSQGGPVHGLAKAQDVCERAGIEPNALRVLPFLC